MRWVVGTEVWSSEIPHPWVSDPQMRKMHNCRDLLYRVEVPNLTSGSPAHVLNQEDEHSGMSVFENQ